MDEIEICLDELRPHFDKVIRHALDKRTKYLTKEEKQRIEAIMKRKGSTFKNRIPAKGKLPKTRTF